MAIIYILSMAIAVTFKFNGEQTDFYTKYFIAASWTILWLLDIILNKKVISKQNRYYLIALCVPVTLIYIWTILLWIIVRPEGWNFSYFSTTSSNILALILAITTAMAAGHFFGRKAISYTVIAIFISTMANTIVVVPQYGISTFIEFLKNAWVVTDLDYSNAMTKLSLALEVHDSTVASGAFLIYYMFLDKTKDKTRWIYIAMLAICAYLGYKREVVYGILIVAVCLWILRVKPAKTERLFKIFSIMLILSCLTYVVALKSGFIEILSDYYGIDFSGRFTIYSYLVRYFNLSIFYLGKGYGFVNKALYDSIGFQSHSDVVRMYAELGFMPYIIWLYYYLYRIPLKVYYSFGEIAGKIMLAMTIYIFVTYFTGNAMNLFASQLSYILIPVALSYPESWKKANKIKFRIIAR